MARCASQDRRLWVIQDPTLRAWGFVFFKRRGLSPRDVFISSCFQGADFFGYRFTLNILAFASRIIGLYLRTYEQLRRISVRRND